MRVSPLSFCIVHLTSCLLSRVTRHVASSLIFCLSVQFFTTLLEKGVEGVETWLWSTDPTNTKWKKKINIFHKKFVFIPVNKGGFHWVFIVLVNIGKILNSIRGGDKPKGPMACVLYFDSLGHAMPKGHFKALLKWLNSTWHRFNPTNGKPHTMFTAETLPLFQPTGQSTPLFLPSQPSPDVPHSLFFQFIQSPSRKMAMTALCLCLGMPQPWFVWSTGHSILRTHGSEKTLSQIAKPSSSPTWTFTASDMS